MRGVNAKSDVMKGARPVLAPPAKIASKGTKKRARKAYRKG